MFQIKRYTLPHDGIIPGARGHKKVIVPAGTKVHCIVYGTMIYWAAYLNEEQALTCLRGLEETISGKARRTIKLDTLVAWNFKDRVPTRIVRPKENCK